VAHGDLGRALLHQLDQPGAGGLGVALWVRVMTSGTISARWSSWRQADVLRAHDLGLAHRDAAIDLPEVFAEGDLVDQLLDLAELALASSRSAQPCIWRSAST
jgi:hypothetical protein